MVRVSVWVRVRVRVRRVRVRRVRVGGRVKVSHLVFWYTQRQRNREET